jgi:hypothetical protein
MNLLCIDPGPVTSGVVLLDAAVWPPRVLESAAKRPNPEVLADINDHTGPVAIERFACMGMAVGEETLEAVHWGGRFHQEADAGANQVIRIKRHEVKMALCGNTRAKDGNIRQALIDLYGGAASIKSHKAATKKAPERPAGPLAHVAADAWAALAVGMTCLKGSQIAASLPGATIRPDR